MRVVDDAARGCALAGIFVCHIFVGQILASQHAHAHPRVDHLRYRLRAEFLIRRVAHLFPRRQVDPELETAHQAVALLRHFGMDDAAGGLHPLRPAGAQIAAIAHAVAVFHVAVEHVGERDETAMRMIRKTGDVLVGIVAAEMVEHQERIEILQRRRAQGAMHSDAGPFGNGDGVDLLLDGTDVHVCLLGNEFMPQPARVRVAARWRCARWPVGGRLRPGSSIARRR